MIVASLLSSEFSDSTNVCISALIGFFEFASPLNAVQFKFNFSSPDYPHFGTIQAILKRFLLFIWSGWIPFSEPQLVYFSIFYINVIFVKLFFVVKVIFI